MTGISPVFVNVDPGGDVNRVSTASDGTQANNASQNSVLSADGTTVAFDSYASNLVDGDTNQASDIFVKTLATGAIVRADVTADGQQANGNSIDPVLSRDGTKVAFLSLATNLAPGVPDGAYEIYVKDLITGSLTLISAAPDGTAANNGGISPAFSADGTAVAFTSSATNLTSGDTNGVNDIFVKTLATGALTRVSVAGDGTQANNQSFHASISADGNLVAFVSYATNLGTPGSAGQIFIKDLTSGALTQIPATTDGSIQLSADGTTLVFASDEIDLVPGDTNHSRDIFLYDVASGGITRVSTAADGSQAVGSSVLPVVSADGTTVLFESNAANLVPTAIYRSGDNYFLKNVVTGAITLVSTAADGTPAHGNVTAATLGDKTTKVSSNGTIVAFSSYANNLVAGDTNGLPDVFVKTFGPDIAATPTGSVMDDVSKTSVSTTGTLFFTDPDPATTHSVSVSPAQGDLGQLSVVLAKDSTGSKTGVIGWTYQVDHAAVLLAKGATTVDTFDVTVANGYGATADQIVTVTVTPGLEQFEFTFTYTDGSSYSGTVVDDGTHGYTPGEIIATPYGSYAITASDGTTALPAGSVSATSYYDVVTNANYDTVTGALLGIADGMGGLGSETDTLNAAPFPEFGEGGKLEARFPMQYEYTFTYTDGNYYSGMVIDDGTYGYKVGEVITTAYGSYAITKSDGLSPFKEVGFVYTTNYHDAVTNTDFLPSLILNGKNDATLGLGSEDDNFILPAPVFGAFAFGEGGKLGAQLPPPYIQYEYTFTYADGNYYSGTVIDNGTYGYTIDEVITTPYGAYAITKNDGTSQHPVGFVYTTNYHDAATNTDYLPLYAKVGEQDGLSGLGSEDDAIELPPPLFGTLEFGEGGKLGAHVPSLFMQYEYTFTYTDGNSYSGTVIDDGTYGYTVGEAITTPYGAYAITKNDGTSQHPVGFVYTTNYHDAATNTDYLPLYAKVTEPDGFSGLGSEHDAIELPPLLFGTLEFGEGGKLGAQVPSLFMQYEYTFTYADGSYYSGTVIDDGTYGYTVGEVITTPYGAYAITKNDGTSQHPVGFVSTTNYHDAATNTDYLPLYTKVSEPDGLSGLGSEHDAIALPPPLFGTLEFGEGGKFEAKMGAAAQLHGVAEDGYIVGGTVTYLDGSGSPTTTENNGAFTLIGGNGPLLLTSTATSTDSATGLPFIGTLEAPAGSTVISAITTLIEKVVADTGDSSTAGIHAAAALVATALGLPPSVDPAILTTFDAVGTLLDPASTADELATAQAIFQAAGDLSNTQALINAAGGSSDTAIATVAQQIAAGQVVDLTDPATLAAAAGLATTSEAFKAVTGIIQATDGKVAGQLAGTTDPITIFEDLTGASIALQQDGSDALRQSGGDYAAASTFYYGHLDTLLAADDATAAQNLAMACYCRFTLIQTADGERPVESLAIGDRLVTAAGALRPIKWIGTRSYAGRFAKANPTVMPICFKLGSLGDGTPRRDLWVSPKHAMFCDGMLIPAEHLVNGSSIVRADAVDLVEYFHIELDSHDVIIAEGALSETFVDDDSRGMFHNVSTYAALYPGDAPVEARYCAPRVEDGYALEAVRRRLAAHAGHPVMSSRSGGALRGAVERIGDGVVAGWAQNGDFPDAPVCLDMLVDGIVTLQVLAERYRADLRQSGTGGGRHGFEITLPEALEHQHKHRRVVRRSSDHAELSRILTVSGTAYPWDRLAAA